MVRCAGCRACVKECKKIHGFLPADEAAAREAVKATTELSATAYTALTDVGDNHARNLCRHCVKPSCASVCPVAALEKTELGPVTYDASKCIGCRYCMVACPFNVPRYEWSKAVPSVRKCDMCIDRMKEGKKPACAEACTYEATVAGTREELLALARKRIAEDPDLYYNHIYGEKEVGGTSVLFLAPQPTGAFGYECSGTAPANSPFAPQPTDAFGYRASLGEAPLPDLTWAVLEKIPGIVIGGGAALMGIWWITKRRDEVAAIERLRARAKRDAAAASREEADHGRS
jgi:formate dehydrogenase iron-sulfur subunit